MNPAVSHASDREADPYALAATAAEQLRARTGPVDLAVVLGSGWNGVVTALGGDTDGIPMSDRAGVAAPTAAGHSGRVHVLERVVAVQRWMPTKVTKLRFAEESGK